MVSFLNQVVCSIFWKFWHYVTFFGKSSHILAKKLKLCLVVNSKKYHRDLMSYSQWACKNIAQRLCFLLHFPVMSWENRIFSITVLCKKIRKATQWGNTGGGSTWRVPRGRQISGYSDQLIPILRCGMYIQLLLVVGGLSWWCTLWGIYSRSATFPEGC